MGCGGQVVVFVVTPALTVKNGKMPGPKLAYSLEYPVPWSAGGTQAEDLAEALSAYHRVHPRELKEPLYLRGEGQPLIFEGVEQGLYPEAVPAEESALPYAVVYSESKYAVELFRALLAIAEVGVQNHLCVTVGIEGIALSFQISPQLGSVIYLAVIGDSALLPLAYGGHRLLAVLGVYDRQSHMGQRAVGGDVDSMSVGPPMGNSAGHTPG